MQQRRGASGRPSGTDGSDFSYRMVVDSRYQRVADGRSRLSRLILVQALHQLIGGALLLLSLSKGTEPNKFAVLSVAAGLLAILVGELAPSTAYGITGVMRWADGVGHSDGPTTFAGRRRTMATLLRMYTSLSSIAVAFSVTYIIRSELFLKVSKQNMAAITSYELIDAVRVALGVLLQLVVIATTTRLLQNMSPPKRAS
ncbi:hypothetical protein PR202_ga07541 [Eleusine coracana subsp. coracana]|uniref:Uncharacterized protein n=1 Tax=Eleusine coracana subsp. coracana TaxID=191504 RepID=A0AAV5BZT8_ELECO|nr:hypothetical protein PR202_ga07541 [Eleusine coracana subsp. coracana]